MSFLKSLEGLGKLGTLLAKIFQWFAARGHQAQVSQAMEKTEATGDTTAEADILRGRNR